MKYCAYVRRDLDALFVIDEGCDEVFADIFPNDPVLGRLGSAEKKLTEFGFTRVGDWTQFPDSWVAEVTTE